MYGVATPSPVVLAALPVATQIIRELSPQSSPPRSPPGRRAPRARQGSRSPKKVDVQELEEKFKELQQQRQKDEIEHRTLEKNQRREAVNNHQTLLRQHRMAERDMLKREQEVDRLEKNMYKVKKETQAKSAKQSDTVLKIEETMERLMQRQQELEQQLEEKVKEAAQAKGRLSHIEFAHNLLSQSNVAVPTSKQLEDDVDASRGALAIIAPNLSQEEREQLLLNQAEELRSVNRKRAEENAQLRKQLDEIKRLDASRPLKPSFACVGGELGGGTFYNLWDEGLDSNLGPGFSFSATIRYDKYRRGSKVFDFGSGESMDNIYVGNREETSTLVFGAYQGSRGTTLAIKDFWRLGEAHVYLFVVTPEGQMKVFCDGELMGSKKGPSLRTTERRNLYVGRSNWASDAPFEGIVSQIKVWSRDVKWSSTVRSLKETTAESWALDHSPPPGTATSFTYPGGKTINFTDFSSVLAPLRFSNQCHRKRLLEDIESGNHTRAAVLVYQGQSWEQEGFLQWRTGEVCEFIKLVFQEFSLVPPNESQLYPLYAMFGANWSNEISTLDSFCLLDAVLRVVFFSEAGALNETFADSEANTQAPTGRSVLGGSMQPEASGQPSAASTRRLGLNGSFEAPSVSSCPAQSVTVPSTVDLSASRGMFPITTTTRASPGHSSTTAALGSTYASSGYTSPGRLSSTSVRSISPITQLNGMVSHAASPGRVPVTALQSTAAIATPLATASSPQQYPGGLNAASLYRAYMQVG